MKKLIMALLVGALLLNLVGCGASQTASQAESSPAAEEPAEETAPEQAGVPVQFQPLYKDFDQVIRLEYQGLNMDGLAAANLRYGSEGFGDTPVDQGCSITFAQYVTGTVGAVRNMDLHLSEYSSYEMLIHPGENVKYTTWGLAYTGVDEKPYSQILEEGISAQRYITLPFTNTDTMSYGVDDNGKEGSLYCALLMRSDEQDEEGNYLYTCSGTNPGAPLRCATQSVATLIATQNISIEDALKYTGAVDEQYNRLFPDVEPTLDVYTLNVETENASNHWFEVVAMLDSTGRHGVLEFMDNYAIWHEGADYCFNFFLQEDYLHNEDGTYKETGGGGIGRMQAVVPYLDKIHTVADHIDLMDGIRYSYMTYYDEDAGYVGFDWNGDPVDWRTEYAHADPWGMWHKYNVVQGLDTSAADAKYPLCPSYLDTDTGEIVKIGSHDEWLENRDHLKSIYTTQFLTEDANYDEAMNLVRWNGMVFNGLTMDQVKASASGWETYFRVVADPMHFRVTRWFNENILTADSVDLSNLNG